LIIWHLTYRTLKQKATTMKKPTTSLSKLVLPNQLNSTGVKPDMHARKMEGGSTLME
jgi:hypothetical protein